MGQKLPDEDDIVGGLADLVDSLDHDQLERLAVEFILEHRRLLAAAEPVYDAWQAAEKSGPAGTSEGKEAYVRAMLKVRAQMLVLNAIVDKLGYIPDVPPVVSHDDTSKIK